MNNKTNRKHTFFSATRLKDFFIPVHWHLCFLAFVGIFGIAVAGYILTAEAACPQGDNLLKTKGMESAVEAYAFCAIGENEENAQFRLAQYYQNKKNATPQEKMKMLFYYQMIIRQLQAGQALIQRFPILCWHRRTKRRF